MKEWLGWHFLAENRRIAQYPGSAHGGTLVTPGLVLRETGSIAPCVRGLHASIRPIDALHYAPGPIVQRVRLSGTVVEENDKAAASERETLWVMDASLALHIYAVNYAQIALDRQSSRGETIDPRSQAALDVKLRWVGGQASDSELAAARDAAWAAASAAAWAAAWDAARDAARTEQSAILEAALLAQYETGHGVFK